MNNETNPPSLALRNLPPDYQTLYSLDLKKNFRVAMILNMGVLFMFFVWGYFFIQISIILHPSAWLGEQAFLTEIDLIHVVVVFIVMVLLHEGFHGLFFWFFTGERPKFGYKLLYAYAAAPDWYIPRNKYIWIGLAPLILVSIVGITIIPWLPSLLLPDLILLLTVNAAGSMGDAFIILVALSRPKDVLVQDLGDSFTIYGKSS